MWPVLPIMSWILPDPQLVQQQLIQDRSSRTGIENRKARGRPEVTPASCGAGTRPEALATSGHRDGSRSWPDGKGQRPAWSTGGSAWCGLVPASRPAGRPL